MRIAGIVQKMRGVWGTPIQYQWQIGEEAIDVGALLGKTFRFDYQGLIHCLACSRPTRKSYQQGHCFVCANRLASCDLCMVRPERCHYHLGTCREPAWGQAHCFIPHKVYLANTTGLKVGISRAHTLTQRWIDQGAIQGQALFAVKTRQQSGLLEVRCATFVADKTDWRKLLKGDSAPIDLQAHVEALRVHLDPVVEELQSTFGPDAVQWVAAEEPLVLQYPILQYPQVVKSLDLEKQPHFTGTLRGIKGQYLFFEEGALNVRKHSGFQIALDID